MILQTFKSIVNNHKKENYENACQFPFSNTNFANWLDPRYLMLLNFIHQLVKDFWRGFL